MAANDGIALTRRRFELPAAEDAHASVAAGDQSGLLKRMKNDADGGPMHTKHDGEEFVLHRKVVGIDTVVCLQQPPAAALRDVVQRIARGALHGL